MKELNELLLKSFEAHMDWIIPKINQKEQIEAGFAKAHIAKMLKSGKVVPEEMSGDAVWSVYGEKVFDTYKEIYNNNYKRFVEGRGTEVAIERLL